MPTLAEVREKYPQYHDMPDDVLADKLHDKFYKDMPRQEFNAKIGYTEPNAAADAAKSFGTGIAKGALAIPGAAGDVQSLGEKYNPFDYLAGKYREAYPEQAKKNAALAEKTGRVSDIGEMRLPRTSEIRGQVEKVTGPFHEPQTRTGRYAESVGSFVPSAVLGPGGLATRAATTIAGGIGAEAGAEQFGEAGRLIGGLLGVAGAGHTIAEAQRTVLRSQLPTQEAARQAARAAYRMVENERLIVYEQPMNRFTSSLRAGLDQRLLTDVAPRTMRAVGQLEQSGGDVAVILGVRQQLGEIRPSAGDEYAAAQHVRDAIDNFLETVPANEVFSPRPVPGGQNPAQYTATLLDQARGNWRAYAKLEQVATAEEIGRHQAAVAGTGANTQNAMRQRIRAILDNPNTRGYSAAALQQMEDIVMGTWATNTARWMGKFAPSGPVSAMTTMGAALTADLAGGAGMAAGAAAAIAIPATIAKYLGTFLTTRQIRELENIIRSEAPIGRPVQYLQERQNRAQIIPAAAARSGLSTEALQPQSPLRVTVPVPYGEPAQQ